MLNTKYAGMDIRINSLNELAMASSQLLNSYNDQRVFAFYGKMGAGKTTFIKALCEKLGSIDNVTSPTFAIINEYTTSSNTMIYHFDFYRIKNIQEAFDLGYEDYFFSGHYCFIEWPEKIEELLPGGIIKVNIIVEDDEKRTINTTIV